MKKSKLSRATKEMEKVSKAFSEVGSKGFSSSQIINGLKRISEAMKGKTALIVILIALASCSKVKDWKCEVSAKGVSGEWSEPSVVYFTGTKEEMQTYEDNGTYESAIGVSVKTECK